MLAQINQWMTHFRHVINKSTSPRIRDNLLSNIIIFSSPQTNAVRRPFANDDERDDAFRAFLCQRRGTWGARWRSNVSPALMKPSVMMMLWLSGWVTELGNGRDKRTSGFRGRGLVMRRESSREWTKEVFVCLLVCVCVAGANQKMCNSPPLSFASGQTQGLSFAPSFLCFASPPSSSCLTHTSCLLFLSSPPPPKPFWPFLL